MERTQERLRELHASLRATAVRAELLETGARLELLRSIHEVRGQLELRNAVADRNTPLAVLLLLVVCAAMTILGMGFACGLTQDRQRMIPRIFAVLVAAALWIIIDVDFPRAGLVRMDGQPLREVASELEAAVPAGK